MAEHLMMFFGQSPIPDGDALSIPGHELVGHGGQFTSDDTEFDDLMANYYISPLIREVTTDYSTMTRAELEQMASDAGIPNPDDLEIYPHEGSLAAAIENANLIASTPPVEHVSAADQGGTGTFAVEAQEAPVAEPTPEEGEE